MKDNAEKGQLQAGMAETAAKIEVEDEEFMEIEEYIINISLCGTAVSNGIFR